ncbi:MAG: ABC transporter substrate-binding protein [Clostridia bacterium]|nr:ABC transporter substrate-binding protein [Clostridia bacterium]
MSKKLISALLVICLVCLPLFALADGTLNVFNYGEYIDEQVIRNFEKEFGVRVNYSLNSTPEEMYTKLQTGASFDVIVTSDYMIDRLIKEERILPLDKEIVTNLDQITDNMKGLYFDPDNTYSAPYLWQNVVLCYDTTKIDPAKVEEKGWEILLDPELDGHAFIYESPRDVFMMAFKALGYSMNTDNPDELQEAYEWLVKMKQTIHPSFVTDEMIDGMAQGEKWIAMMYSGDAAYASMENEKLAVWAPEQGTNIAIDCMFIPSNASNPEMANQFINYVLDYDNSMMITVETCYTTPNAKVLEDVTAPGGEFEGVEGYLPRSGYEKDEIYQYVKLLQSETPELLIKVKMQ